MQIIVKYGRNIKPYVTREIVLAKRHSANGEMALAFSHLERAHILAQPSPSQHVRTHIHMLWWGIRVFSMKEIAGQLFRILGATTQFVTAYYPSGNTGGANTGPFKELPIPDDLQEIINRAKSAH